MNNGVCGIAVLLFSVYNCTGFDGIQCGNARRFWEAAGFGD